MSIIRPRDGVRWAARGCAAAAVYVAVSSLGWGVAPIRLLYDGFAPPPPYRWVHPPSSLARDNQPPDPGVGTIALTRSGSEAGEISTDDSQAVVIFAPDSIAPRSGESTVAVRITPVDPLTVASPPPGMDFDGNGYRIDLRYAASQAQAVLIKPVIVILRYPTDASRLLWLSGSGWIPLAATRAHASLQVFASTDHVGIFVAAASSAARRRTYRVAAIAAAAGLLAATGVLVARRRRGGRRNDRRPAAP
jgi:hypothetical protein